MNLKICLIIALLIISVAHVKSEDADDIYVKIYEKIQQADSLNQSGDSKLAVEKYLEAKSELEKFQQNFPSWNPNVVKYRLNYLSEKISSLGGAQQIQIKADQQPSKVAEQPQQQPQGQIKTKEIPEEVKNQIQILQQQLSQLKAERDQLQVKLKEALSVQPVAVDPGELQRANEKIRNLEKQVELLQVSINHEKDRSSKLIEPAAFAAVQKALAETSEKLDRQTRELSLLAKQKEELEKSLKEEQARFASKSEQKEIKRLQNKIEDLNKAIESQNRTIASLKKEKEDLTKRLRSKSPVSSDIENLTAENQLLKQQIEQLKNQSLSDKTKSMKEQLDATKEELSVLKGKYEALKIEKELLEARLKNSNTNPLSAEMDARIKDLETRLTASASENVIKDKKIKGLMAEKEALEKSLNDAAKQIDDYKQSVERIKNLEKELALANIKAEEAGKKLNSLIKEKSELEKQIASIASENKALNESRLKNEKRVRELEKENEDLQKKLNSLTKEFYNVQKKSQVAKVSELESQVNALRARLDVYESKSIPFTKEELEIMKTAELSKVQSDVGQPRKVKELPPDASKLVIEAQGDIESGRLKQAETKLQEVLKYDSAHLSTLFRLASVQIEQNNLDEAEKTINKALSIDPQDAGALFLLGVLNEQRGKLDEAIEAFGKSIKSNPNNPDTQIYLGLALSKKGLRAQAETAFRKALQLQPGNPMAHLNLAVIYASQNPPFLELARWHYQKALANGAKKDPELEKKLNNASSSQ
jgi:Flp pilus assembly protein TadD/predicted  nucleic acid-binding Zn-ribbon protein